MSKTMKAERRPSIDLGSLQHEDALAGIALKKAEAALAAAMERHLAAVDRKTTANKALRAGSSAVIAGN